MSKLKSDEIKKVYFKPAEASKMTGLSTSSIGFFADKYQMRVKRNRKGTRQFTEENIHQLLVIKDLVYRRQWRHDRAVSCFHWFYYDKEEDKVKVKPDYERVYKKFERISA